MLYLVAKTRRQSLDWCLREDVDPTSKDVLLVERITDVAGFEPDAGHEVVFLGVPFGFDAADRRVILSTLGIKDAS